MQFVVTLTVLTQQYCFVLSRYWNSNIMHSTRHSWPVVWQLGMKLVLPTRALALAVCRVAQCWQRCVCTQHGGRRRRRKNKTAGLLQKCSLTFLWHTLHTLSGSRPLSPWLPALPNQVGISRKSGCRPKLWHSLWGFYTVVYDQSVMDIFTSQS